MSVPETSVETTKKSYRPNIAGRAWLRGLCVLPVPLLAYLGRGLGWFFYVFDRRRRHIAEVNLKLCFPELTASGHIHLLRNHFLTSGQALLCTLGIIWYRPRRRLTKWVRLIGREHYDNALRQNRNIIIVAPHFLGVELAFARLSMEQEIVGMYRPPRHNILHWALDHKRRQFGAIPIENDGSLRKLIRILRNGVPFYYAPDLDQGRTPQHVYAPFFGHTAATVTALSRLAKMTNAVVLPYVARQLDSNKGYEARFYPPLENFPGVDVQADAERMNGLIESWVRENPEQYFWIHRRFKTRPGNEKSLYK